MKHNRQLAAALACALALGLCGGHVLADGTPDPSQIVPAPELIGTPSSPAGEDAAGNVSAPPAANGQGGQSEALSDAARSDLPGQEGALSQTLPELTDHRELVVDSAQKVSQDAQFDDPAGTVSFEHLEARLRENNLNLLALDENLNAIAAVDLDEMRDGLEMAVGMMKKQQGQLAGLVEGVSATMTGLQEMLENLGMTMDTTLFTAALVAYPQATIASLDTQIAAMEDTIEQIDDGTIESQYDSASAQLMNAQNQIVMGAETLYISLLGLEQTQQGLERNLAALDRTLAELDVRYAMGQISSLTLAEAKAGRTALVSGMDTLNMNLTGLRRQLEGMLGLEETPGTITLAPLVAVSDADIAAMDFEADLKKVKRYSYALDSATDAWNEAEEAYHDVRKSDTAPEYEVDMARYTARAADLSRQATEQSLELSFASLFDQVKDQQQVLAAARVTLAVKEDSYAAAQIKYQQGAISYHDLCDAADAAETARDTVETAQIDLFTYYNNYCWAVEHGILN